MTYNKIEVKEMVLSSFKLNLSLEIIIPLGIIIILAITLFAFFIHS